MAEHVLDFGQTPTVNPTGAPGNDYQSIQANPDAFGASVGKASEGLGTADVQAGVTGLDALTARQNLQNETHATEVQTWTADQLSDRYSQHEKLQGKAAMDDLPNFKQDIADIQKRAIGQAGSDASRELIAKATAPLLDKYYLIGTEHADKQMNAYQDQTSTASAATFGG